MIQEKKRGQRKTQIPCEGCGLHLRLCICAEIPRLELATRLCLVIHTKELKRTTNTGRLAVTALTNSEMRVRGEKENQVDLSDLLNGPYQSLLLYPSDNASELTPQFLKSLPNLPIQLVVPDGNWRQAGKVHYRHKELASLPRVKLKNAQPTANPLRKEFSADGMATLEAIAHAFGVIENLEVREKLLKLYQRKLFQTLKGRGQMEKSVADFQ